MATIQVLPLSGIPTGAAAAVEQVQDTMAVMRDQMDAYSSQLQGVIGSIIDAATIEQTEFAQPDLALDTGNVALNPISTPDLAVVTTIDTNAPVPNITVSIPDQPTLNYPSAPVLQTINVPNAPTMSIGAAPARPSVDTNIVVPDAPVVELPPLPDLVAISIPVFVAPELPTFDDLPPEFNVAVPSASINYTEPVYASESFDEVRSTIRIMREGGYGLPAPIEQAIFERGRSREERQLEKNLADIADSYAARGFEAPPGVMAAEVRSAREAAALTVTSLSRDVLIKATDTQIENLRFSVIQGLAAEQLLINLFNNATQRLFEMAKFEVEAAIQLFNAQISVFNALMQGYQVKAQVYKTRIDGELAKLEVIRIQLEAEKLKGEINKQLVDLYEAQSRAVLSLIEVYKAQLQGVQSKVDIVKALFDAYRTDVQAFSETIGAEKLKFDAHKALVDGEVAKGQINTSSASVFSTLVSAENSKAENWRAAANVEVARVGALATVFGAQNDSFRSVLQAQIGRVQAETSIKQVAVQAVQAYNQGATSANEANIRIAQQKQDANVTKAQLGLKLYEVNITKLNQQKEVQTRALQAVGQYLATLAGGAMAAQHVSASISSGASDGYSVSRSETISNSLSEKL